jgi:hypothetical protein
LDTRWRTPNLEGNTMTTDSARLSVKEKIGYGLGDTA